MTKHYAIKAQARDGAGKGVARALRREGRVPAVIYGNNEAPVLVSLPEKEMSKQYHTGHAFTTLCDLDVDGKKVMTLARDIQLHPVKDTIDHVDFLRVSEKTRLNVDIPVHMVGHEESPGLESKGILNVVRHSIELNCQATKIPEYIEVNLAGKDLGDSVNASDATLPAGAQFVIDDRDFTIATIVAPKRADDLDEEEAEGEEGETAEGESEETAEAEGESEE